MVLVTKKKSTTSCFRTSARELLLCWIEQNLTLLPKAIKNPAEVAN